MKLLLTGITGFLGSHLAVTLLADPTVRIAALVRADDATRARARVRTALATAAHDQGLAQAPDLHQITVIAVPPTSPAHASGIDVTRWWQQDAWQDWMAAPVADRSGTLSDRFQVVHCAANLSFKAEDKPAVFATNVDGTLELLAALRGAPVTCFNYVSTAFVAGRDSGQIAAERAQRMPAFNNPYEESKFVTEQLVAEHSAREGMPFRTLRPSIIIGHSRTHRSSSEAGFFKVLAQLSELARKGMLDGAKVHLGLPDDSTVDLVAIDAVVTEMVDLLDSGPATHGMTFHLTCEQPLRIADVFKTCTPQTGIELVTAPRGAAPTPLDRMVGRSLKHYLPYFGLDRTFDRRNVHACGAARRSDSARTSLDLLLSISREYLEQVMPTQVQVAAPLPAPTTVATATANYAQELVRAAETAVRSVTASQAAAAA